VNPRVKITLQWLLLAPAMALTISFASRYCLEFFSPGKLTGYRELLTNYPLGLFLSLLSPWGWLMYGGLILMPNGRRRPGLWCSIGGGVIFGLFWPIWAAFLN
jgi:hypothetical protein